MKKLILLFAVTTLVIIGCTERDYGCETDYLINNQTKSELTIEIASKNKQFIIRPGEKQVIYYTSGLCGKNTKPDGFSEGVVMKFRLKINKKFVPEEMLERQYWDFVSELYLATYTLTVTDELLQSLENESGK